MFFLMIFYADCLPSFFCRPCLKKMYVRHKGQLFWWLGERLWTNYFFNTSACLPKPDIYQLMHYERGWLQDWSCMGDAMRHPVGTVCSQNRCTTAQLQLSLHNTFKLCIWRLSHLTHFCNYILEPFVCYDEMRLLRSLVTYFFIYACKSWTLDKDIERKIQTFEMRCYRRILRIR